MCPAVTPTPRGTSRRHGEPPGARAPSRTSVSVHGGSAHGSRHAARPHEAATRVVAKSVDEDLGKLLCKVEQKTPRDPPPVNSGATVRDGPQGSVRKSEEAPVAGRLSLGRSEPLGKTTEAFKKRITELSSVGERVFSGRAKMR